MRSVLCSLPVRPIGIYAWDFSPLLPNKALVLAGEEHQRLGGGLGVVHRDHLAFDDPVIATLDDRVAAAADRGDAARQQRAARPVLKRKRRSRVIPAPGEIIGQRLLLIGQEA